jgi:hypothetical protein
VPRYRLVARRSPIFSAATRGFLVSPTRCLSLSSPGAYRACRASNPSETFSLVMRPKMARHAGAIQFALLTRCVTKGRRNQTLKAKIRVRFFPVQPGGDKGL